MATIMRDPMRRGARFIDKEGVTMRITYITQSSIWYVPEDQADDSLASGTTKIPRADFGKVRGEWLG